MRLYKHLLLCGLLLFMGISVKAQTAAGEDVVMTLLQQELTKEFSVLSKREIPMVYMAFTVKETKTSHQQAMMGSPMEDYSDHSRCMNIVFYVGNDNPISNEAPYGFFDIPIHDYDEQLLRNTIVTWVRTHYEKAVVKYQKQQIERRFSLAPSKDFVPPAFTFNYDEPVADGRFDNAHVMDYLCQTTSMFDEVITGTAYATLDYIFTRTWFVDSEGSCVVKNKDGTKFELRIKGNRADGRNILVNREFLVDSPIKLPQENDMNKIVEELSEQYDEKLNTPARDESGKVERLSFLNAYEPHHDQVEESFGEMVFRALQDEVEEVDWELHDKSMPKPYQSSYQVVNGQNFQLLFQNGALYKKIQRPVCYLGTRLFLGSNKLNNEGVECDNSYDEFSTMPLPMDAHYDNFRRVLRLSEDAAYQKAWKEYEYKSILLNNLPAQVLANRQQDRAPVNALQYEVEEEYERVDFNRLEAVASELAYALAYGRDSLSLENSADYFDHFSIVEVNGCQADVYYFSTDGIRTQQPFSVMCLRLVVMAPTPDGKQVRDFENFYFRKFDDLPDRAVLLEKAVALRNRVHALSMASPMDAVYDGPVIIVDDAAAQVFAHAFTDSNGLYAYRLPLTPECREACVGNPLESKVGHPVTNPSLSVFAKDTHCGSNLPLIGRYVVDSEGVRVPETIDLITRGELNNLLTTRVPTEKSKNSNGHSRLTISMGMLRPTVGAGVLQLVCHKQMGEQKMKRQLCAQARAAGYDYAYIIRKFDDALNDSFGRFFIPTVVYSVDVRTGKETLVRGIMGNVRFADFWQLSASSHDTLSYNLMVNGHRISSGDGFSPLRGIPCSVEVPQMLYFDRLRLYPEE